MYNAPNFIQILQYLGVFPTLILIFYLEFRLIRYCFGHCRNYKPKGDQ